MRDLKDIGLEYHSDLHLEEKIAEAGTYSWNLSKQNDDCYKPEILVEIEWMWETTSEPVSNPGSLLIGPFYYLGEGIESFFDLKVVRSTEVLNRSGC